MRYILLFLLFINITYAHQIQVEIKKEKAVVIRLFYPDGTAFSYEKFEIYSPRDNKIPFQVGRTDKLGRIVFIPNEIGKWKVKAISQDGHGINKEIDINKNLSVDKKNTDNYYFFKILGAILLIIVIFLILNQILNQIFRGKNIEKENNNSSN